MDPVVAAAVAALDDRDWAALRPLLHPYLHWTRLDGVTVRGRTQVLRLLDECPPPGPPARYELRDGQVYRWAQA